MVLALFLYKYLVSLNLSSDFANVVKGDYGCFEVS